MKRFTIGITTYNEEQSIAMLLSSLATLATDEADIILYDDCSTDGTKQIVLDHPIAQQSNFRAHFASANNGTPSVGRTYIGKNAATEYVALVDGDDHVDVAEFRQLIARAPSGYDMILTSYALRGERVTAGPAEGPVTINGATMPRILSGIGGKVYRSSLLARHGHDDVRGRSDDVRLNMRILLTGAVQCYRIPEICFYVITESRKSTKVATLNFDEIGARVENFRKLHNYYPLDDRYLYMLRNNLRKVINGDDEISESHRKSCLNLIENTIKINPARIVFIANSIDEIGGIPQRIRKTIISSKGRSVEYVVLSKEESDLPGVISIHPDQDNAAAMLSEWHRSDTVFITANNILRSFPKGIVRKIEKFPIIYMCSAQLAFFIQDANALLDLNYVRKFRVSRIISFSDADMSFQRQLGIHGQVKGFLPTIVRDVNSYDVGHARRMGYVGRIDFHAKGCERLIDVAHAAQAAALPPIRVFTTAGANSPDYGRFVEMIDQQGLTNQFEIVLECKDKDVIYGGIGWLLLPSKKESFGNVILEANSYGIPVIAASYAPGPAELVEDGKTGYLLEEFRGDKVIELINATDSKKLRRLSKQAHEKHKNYSMDKHLDFLESVAYDVINEPAGGNVLPVFPELKMIGKLQPSANQAKPAKNGATPAVISVRSKEDRTSRVETVKKNPELIAMEAEIRRLEQRRSR